MSDACGALLWKWDGEYEGYCELTVGHEGDHFDGVSWFDDDEFTDYRHPGARYYHAEKLRAATDPDTRRK